MNTNQWALGRRDLTEAELADFRNLWNDEIAPLGREGIEAQGFSVVLGPGVVHLDWPLDDDEQARHVLVTVHALDGTWTPGSTVDPAGMSNVLDHIAEGLQDIRDLANAREDHQRIADRAFELNDIALRSSVSADNAAVRLAPIPEGCALEGVGLVYEPDEATAA